MLNYCNILYPTTNVITDNGMSPRCAIIPPCRRFAGLPVPYPTTYTTLPTDQIPHNAAAVTGCIKPTIIVCAATDGALSSVF